MLRDSTASTVGHEENSSTIWRSKGVTGWGFYRGLGPDVRCKVSILSSTRFEWDSLWFGFGIEFRIRCDLGEIILRLLRSRPQVEDEFDSVTWATGLVQSLQAWH
jgi:hypothetical protein